MTEAHHTKQCSKCKTDKPLAMFASCSGSSDGRGWWCRECRRVAAAEYRKNNPEKALKAERAWRARNPHKVREYAKSQYIKQREQKVEYSRNYRKRSDRKEQKARYAAAHPERDKARQAVASAVYNGTIAKPLMCEKCGRAMPPIDLHGHHNDYGKPLEVVWMCRPRHNALHDAQNAQAALHRAETHTSRLLRGTMRLAADLDVPPDDACMALGAMIDADRKTADQMMREGRY